MNQRKQKLLNLVIDNYIATAEPIGSRFLLSSGKLDCGEATIRNELRALEQSGYLVQPHTSAGRTPTAKAYRYYIDSIDKSKLKVSKKQNDIMGMSIDNVDNETERKKNIAKALVELSGQTVLLAMSRDSLYYTGLSNLFSQPEFVDVIADVSKVFDHCEQCLDDFYEIMKENVECFIGDEQPFGTMLSVISGSVGKDGLVILLGPIRMDYKKNISLVSKAVELIS